MKTTSMKFLKYSIIILLPLLFFCWAPVEFGNEKVLFHGYTIQKPVIRIGLGVNLSYIKISSSSGMKIYEINSNYKLVADVTDEIYIKGRKEKITEKFVIQVAQSKERENAEIFAQDLGTKIENKVYVTENSESEISGIFQVMVGDFITRENALSFIKQLNQIGIADTWIMREEITEEESKPLWILVNEKLKSLHDDTVLYFIPSHPKSFLSFNGRDYRGIFVLRTTHKGIVLINVLNLEDYLKGVVPSELSPYTYSELEAHKAQAVAARTYVMRHLGQNKELDFDICDSPKSQFYKGMKAEHPLSTEAVESTKGEVALYKGRLINALYTSTCGGKTENVENIFDGPPLPYLRSEECVTEKQNEWLLKSRNVMQPINMSGKNISPEIAVLISLNIIHPETNPAYYQQKASFEEALNWIRNAMELLGKKNEKFNPETSPLNLVTLARLLVDAFEWHNRVENLLLKSERDFIMKDFESLKDEEKNSLAYLIQAGVFLSSIEIGSPERFLSRGELAYYLGKVIQSYRDIGSQGIFKGFSEDKIKMEEEKEKKQFVLSPDVFLLENNSGDYSFASHLYLLEGEEVRLIEREGKVQLLEVVSPPHTNILDRSSAFHRWQIRISRNALERRINRFYPIGKLVDIIPQKRGESRRVVELLIKGTESQAVVKGLKIRRVLGVRETLFVIDREYEKEGGISCFTFYGKGLGHGVGLCQVGAFGMAQTGAKYKEILKKYYRGIKISKIY